MNSRVEQMQLIEKGDHEGRTLRNQKKVFVGVGLVPTHV